MVPSAARELWRPTSPESTQMYKFMQHINSTYSLQLGALSFSPRAPPTPQNADFLLDTQPTTESSSNGVCNISRSSGRKYGSGGSLSSLVRGGRR